MMAFSDSRVAATTKVNLERGGNTAIAKEVTAPSNPLGKGLKEDMKVVTFSTAEEEEDEETVEEEAVIVEEEEVATMKANIPLGSPLAVGEVKDERVGEDLKTFSQLKTSQLLLEPSNFTWRVLR